MSAPYRQVDPSSEDVVSLEVVTNPKGSNSRFRRTRRRYTVGVTGASILANSRKCTVEGETARRSSWDNPCCSGQSEEQPATEPEQEETWMWKSQLKYDQAEGVFWFNPFVSEEGSPTAAVPSRRQDIFLNLGREGSSPMPWPLQEGDAFRLGHTYVCVSKVFLPNNSRQKISDLPPSFLAENHRRLSIEEGETQEEEAAELECCFCYDAGTEDDPLVRPCLVCKGTSPMYVHGSCMRKWAQPDGDLETLQMSLKPGCAVPSMCPTCKAELSAEVLQFLVDPPCLLLEAHWSHRKHQKKQWVSFTQHDVVTLGRQEGFNDVVIPDHTVSKVHAHIMLQNNKFWLHDQSSSRGTFIPLREPLKLPFGRKISISLGRVTICMSARHRWLFVVGRIFRAALLPSLFSSKRRSSAEVKSTTSTKQEVEMVDVSQLQLV